MSCLFFLPFETKTSKKLYNLPERHHRAIKTTSMTNLQAHLGFVFANKKLRRFKMRFHAAGYTGCIFFCAAHSGKDILSKWFSFYDIDKKENHLLKFAIKADRCPFTVPVCAIYKQK